MSEQNTLPKQIFRVVWFVLIVLVLPCCLASVILGLTVGHLK